MLLAELRVGRDRFGVRRLSVEDAAPLQQLYEAAQDYALLIDGVPPLPTAARDEFSAVPPGVLSDKFMFGAVDDKDHYRCAPRDGSRLP